MKIKIQFFGRERGAIGIPYKISQIIETKKENQETWEKILAGCALEKAWQMEEFAPITEKWEINRILDLIIE